MSHEINNPGWLEVLLPWCKKPTSIFLYGDAIVRVHQQHTRRTFTVCKTNGNYIRIELKKGKKLEKWIRGEGDPPTKLSGYIELKNEQINNNQHCTLTAVGSFNDATVIVPGEKERGFSYSELLQYMHGLLKTHIQKADADLAPYPSAHPDWTWIHPFVSYTVQEGLSQKIATIETWCQLYNVQNDNYLEGDLISIFLTKPASLHTLFELFNHAISMDTPLELDIHIEETAHQKV